MSSSLKARIATALLLAGVVVVVLLFLPPTVATVLIAIAIFAAAWEWAGFARLTSGAARLAYAAGVSIALVLVEMLTRDPRWLEIVLRATALWWLVAFAWLALRAQAGGPAAAGIVGFLALVPAGLGLDRLVLLEPNGPLLLLYLIVLIAAADVGAYFGGTRARPAQARAAREPRQDLGGIRGGHAVGGGGRVPPARCCSTCRSGRGCSSACWSRWCRWWAT